MSATLGVEEAVHTALRNNPALAAARLRIDEARGRLQQSGRLSNPELEAEFAKATKGRENELGVALMQRFPLTARLRHEKAVSRAELAAAEAEVRDAERKLSAEVRTLAIKLLALQGQRDLRAKQLANSRELSEFLLKRVESGEIAAVDAAQVDLESRQIELESLQLDAEATAMRGELLPLLGRTRSDAFTISGSLASPGALPATTANVASRPDLAAARSRADAAQAAAREQRARRWEDVGAGLSYTRERMMDEPEPIETEQMIGFQLSVPLPLWNNNAGRIREAEAAAVRAEKEVDAVRTTAAAEAHAARASMAVYAQLIREIEERVLPTATQIEEQFRTSYSTGQTPLADVLRARARRLEIQGQRLDALRDYHLARVRRLAATASQP